MKLSAKISSAIFLVMLFGCSSRHQEKKELSINEKIAESVLGNRDKAALLNCISCSCFVPAIKDAYKNAPDYWESMPLFADSACIRFPFKTYQADQKRIDSISDELYNLILFKKRNNQYDIRIVEPKESLDLQEVFEDFFLNSP